MTPGFAKPRDELPWLPYPEKDRMFVINAHNFPSGFSPAVNGKMPIAAWIPSRDSAGNGTTTLTDLSGNAINGTFASLPTTAWVANTDAGGVRALDFTGANQWVDSTANPTGLAFTLPISFSSWFRPRNLGAGKRGGIVNIGNATAGAGEISLHVADSQLQITIIGSGTFSVNSTTLTNNQWVHIVSVFTSSGWSLYLNGTLNATRANNGTPTGNRILRIGRRASVAQNLDGLLDDVRVFNAALDTADVADLHASGTGRGIDAS